MTADPLGVTRALPLGPSSATVYLLDRLTGVDPAGLARRPRTTRILLENILRHFDPALTDLDTVRALASGRAPGGSPEFAFYPERVLLQDFTGVPVVTDLTTLRDAAVARGLDPRRVNPVVPVDLVVDHSVQVDSYGSPRSLLINLDREYERNGERYRFLRWAKGAYSNFRIVPPGNGIVHQVNLEHTGTVVTFRGENGGTVAFPDSLIGTDSHTTMINGLSVLGWGVGGIEAEAVLLGEPYFLPVPEVVGVELVGQLPPGATATDLVLTVTHRLREKGVVDKFVEFVGPGVAQLSVPDRATISNMCPEYGATSAMFPIDEATTAYLRATARDANHVAGVEAYARAQGLWGTRPLADLDFDETLTIDLASVVPTVAGPRNPEESVPLTEAAASFRAALAVYRKAKPRPTHGGSPTAGAGTAGPAVDDGAVVIAAITSCTNTSNPTVMMGAGLIAKKARALGLTVPPYVKTSLAPGSKVVTTYLERAGLLHPLEELGFDVVGYGCTTCIGNSGPLPEAVARQVTANDAYVAAVLSGNRNFEARIHNQVRANYLASPMLVVAYALAGRMDVDIANGPVARRPDGTPVFLKDLWPTPEEIRTEVERNLDPQLFREKYQAIEVGDRHWEALNPPTGDRYPWDSASTYLKRAPYLELPPPWLPRAGLLAEGVRALAVLGDRITTDHISPAGEIPVDSPAGRYLTEHGVAPAEFNTYGSRRGHDEVLVRGTFANVRIRNQLVGPKEGGFTAHLPTGEVLTIYEAAQAYRREGVPLVVLAGKSYGQGSSRDWAAKGPRLLGVGAVIAESFERIHRTNLVEMGVLPLQFEQGKGWAALGLTGRESFSFRLAGTTDLGPGAAVDVAATSAEGKVTRFAAVCRIQSPRELEYYRAGGVLPYVMEHRFASAP